MIQNIWIIDKESGRNMFHKVYGSQVVDKDLFSGFLTALYSFAESEIQSQGPGLESVQMGGLQWLYSELKGLLFIIAADKKDDSTLLKSQLELIKDAFKEKFSIFQKGDRGARFLRKWDGSPKAFKEFEETIDSYHESWKKAVISASLADQMDTLEVFQHILDIIRDITIPFYKNPRKIWEQIGAKFKEIIEQEGLEGRIQVSEDAKINLLPQSHPITIPELLRIVEKLITEIYKSTSEVIGEDKLQSQVNLSLSRYLKKDWKRIKSLNLDDYIIDKILL
ncbi:MAG: hypothetical protein ACTSVM_04595 [Candidatus Ranarchaeia archaeon]